MVNDKSNIAAPESTVIGVLDRVRGGLIDLLAKGHGAQADEVDSIDGFGSRGAAPRIAPLT
jgi:hypothetical protein